MNEESRSIMLGLLVGVVTSLPLLLLGQIIAWMV